MKFHQLPLGASFEFQGKRYTKSGPMTASSETGESKMMMRASAVKPLDGDSDAPPPPTSIELNRERASIVINDYHAECLQILNESGHLDPAANEKLDQAKQRVLKKLGI
ncbi:MAG: hypothetical protein ABW086_01030 [Sedimenticola sp.]